MCLYIWYDYRIKQQLFLVLLVKYELKFVNNLDIF